MGSSVLGLGAGTKICPLLPHTNPPDVPILSTGSGLCGFSTNTAFSLQSSTVSGHERPPLAARRRLRNTSSQHAAGAALRTLSPLLQKAQAWPHTKSKRSHKTHLHTTSSSPGSVGTAPRSPPRAARWRPRSLCSPGTGVPHACRTLGCLRGGAQEVCGRRPSGSGGWAV